MNIQTDLLDLSDSNVRRRNLLSWWIKIFIWIFLVFGVIIPVALIFGIMGKKFQISLYGIETKQSVIHYRNRIAHYFFVENFCSLWLMV